MYLWISQWMLYLCSSSSQKSALINLKKSFLIWSVIKSSDKFIDFWSDYTLGNFLRAYSALV